MCGFFKVPGSNWITEDEHYKKKVEWTMIMATKCAVWAHTNLSPYLEYVDHSHTFRVKFLKTNGWTGLCVSNLSKYWSSRTQKCQVVTAISRVTSSSWYMFVYLILWCYLQCIWRFTLHCPLKATRARISTASKLAEMYHQGGSKRDDELSAEQLRARYGIAKNSKYCLIIII